MAKLSLDSTKILQKVFKGQKGGYDSTDVDAFLDEIIKDYRIVEQNCLLLQSELDELNKKISDLHNKNSDLEIELVKYKARLNNIKDGDNVTTDNIELIRKINLYEKALYDHNIDPTKLK
jgi:DivIVA domain-containing protein